MVADSLGMDLYQVDLSSIVDKYIGETEKNLERVFVEAEATNAVLFFDEADALFGSRSEVKDAKDRYANQEIAYLLQRMEQFDGITVLASNLRGNIDPAFARRLHFMVAFPDPDEPTRQRLWTHHLADLATDPDGPGRRRAARPRRSSSPAATSATWCSPPSTPRSPRARRSACVTSPTPSTASTSSSAADHPRASAPDRS